MTIIACLMGWFDAIPSIQKDFGDSPFRVVLLLLITLLLAFFSTHPFRHPLTL